MDKPIDPPKKETEDEHDLLRDVPEDLAKQDTAESSEGVKEYPGPPLQKRSDQEPK